MRPSSSQVRHFQKTVWNYYRRHGRMFPWRSRSHSYVLSPPHGRGPRKGEKVLDSRFHGNDNVTEGLDPYAVLVSEVMLQQTQVDRVIPFFERWMKRFPSLSSLAKAKTDEVLRAWQGLGYNRRALALKRAVEAIVREHGGNVPRDREALEALPGVGPYTAGAILAFAWNEPVVFVETNIRTVFLHHFFKGRKKVRDEEIVEVIEKTLPAAVPLRPDLSPDVRSDLGEPPIREWYSALMDYGAMLKESGIRVNARSAHYATQQKFKESRRELRGAIVRKAAKTKTVSPHEFSSEYFSVADVMRELVREGFLKKKGTMFLLA